MNRSDVAEAEGRLEPVLEFSTSGCFGGHNATVNRKHFL